MNKQELIEKYEEYENGLFDFGAKIACQNFLKDLQQLDEPQKVKVPQFVADWIERSKQEKRNLRNALNNGGEKMRLWFLDQENYDLFARAWFDGYEVEEEKRYTVVMKETKQPLYYNAGDKKLFFSLSSLATKFTRKQLEEANFGWVFDCPGIEIEEVEG
jgi:hypothetical protein